MAADEVSKRVLNCLPSTGVERDWRLGNALQAGLLAAAPPLPSAIDLRENWWGIGDQGHTGSCVGWATADSLLRWHLVKATRVQPVDRPSVRFIWMAAKEASDVNSQPTTMIESAGTTLKDALDVARNFGVVLETTLGFDPAALYQGEVETFYALAAQLKINSYFNLGTGPDDWRTWLAQQGPILTRLEVDRTWDQATSTGGNLDDYQPGTVRGGHAVSLVGYTPDRLIVRNSWGTEWGDGGFAYASTSYAQAAFTEAYGISA